MLLCCTTFQVGNKILALGAIKVVLTTSAGKRLNSPALSNSVISGKVQEHYYSMTAKFS